MRSEDRTVFSSVLCLSFLLPSPMNPTKAEIAVIQSFMHDIGGWYLGNGEILGSMKATTVCDGPDPADVPRPYTIAEIFAALTPDSVADVESYPAFYELTLDIKQNNSTAVLAAFEAMAALNRITADELAGVAAIVNATVPNPDHSFFMPWDHAKLGRPVDTADINVARHSPGGQGP